MIKVRKFESNDYEMVVSWWKAYEWPSIPPLDSLPTDGFISYEDDKPLAVGFVYIIENAPWTLLTWMTTNRVYNKDKRIQGLNEVIKEGKNFSKLLGKKFIFTFNSQNSIIDSLVSNGFQRAEKDVVTLGYDILGDNIDYIKDDHFNPII